MIVVVGAGPGGMAAAVTAAKAAQSKAEVTLLDDNPAVGGQIWRGGNESPWFRRLSESGVKVLTGARVVDASAAEQVVWVDQDGVCREIRFSKLILATGARELFLPFPGWTLPNVMGVGGLQALVKSGLPVKGKRVVVAGSGPLLAAVAAYLKKVGAVVPLIAEQARMGSVVSFGLGLVRHPGKLGQAFSLNPLAAGIRYLTDCWVEAALGSTKVERVRLRKGKRVWEDPCDFVANAYGFEANTELAALLGCALEGGIVKVDEVQRTSLTNVFCAGEAAGIGGVDKSIVEGQIAGYGAAGETVKAGELRSEWRKADSFAQHLNKGFELRGELRSLAQPDTIVCRCEDVPLGRLRSCDSWRSAKLHERCGMGPCQGRVCGPAVRFILGWEPSSVRPPVFPTRFENLAQEKSVS